jgi:hypothetical protein
LIKRFLPSRAIGLQEGVCEDDKLSHDSGQGDFRWLSGFDEVRVFGLHVGIQAGGDEGGHVEGLADVGATA